MFKKNIKITSEYELVGVACEEFRNFCNSKGIPESISIKVEICLTEALNNVIKHSYGGQEGNDIDLELAVDDVNLSIVIKEYGKAREKITKPTLEFDPQDIENLPEGGMGLFIIEEIMDETIYHSDGKTNTFTMIKNI